MRQDSKKWYSGIMRKVFSRYNLLGVFFVCVAIAFIFKLFEIQVIKGEEYEEMAQKKISSARTVTAERGNILDRNGIPIATNKRTFKAQIFNTGLVAADLNEVLYKSYKILKKNKDGINRTLKTYIDPTNKNKIVYGKMLSSLTTQEDLKKRVELHLDVKHAEGEEITPKSIYDKLKEKYKIDDKYNDTDTFAIMCMRYETRLFSSVRAVDFATNISNKSVAELEEKTHLLQGVSTDKTSTRRYTDAKYISHILGYYRSDDDCTGLESAMQEYLKGTDGKNEIAVNDQGQFVEILDSEPAEPGDNVILTIDMKLQKYAHKVLEKKIKSDTADSGAAIVMNPNNGEVLAMVSYPYYDPNVFLKSSEDKKAQKTITKLFNDNKYPMLNRAISASYPPGSTYKPVVGTAGLEAHKIAPFSSYIYDPRVVYFNGVMRTCLEGGHGSLNLERALETSCNVYFYLLGVKCGIDTVDKWAKAYGLGEKTGIDLAGEVTGERSNRASKERHYGNTEGPWGELNTALSSIGQYLNRFTPIQMARYASSLANGGTLVNPHVIKKAISNNGTVKMTTKVEKKKVGASKSTYAAVKRGMRQSVLSGTSAAAFSQFKYKDAIAVCGKTGTAQMGVGEKDNANFMCFAPMNNPEVVVYVYLNKGGWGTNASYVAKDILNKYYDLKKSSSNNSISILPDGLVLK